ncbi:thioester-containing protein 1 [Anopheles sinensis]|uniref:TEP1-F n=1 Tax=Anopheles sinensis TaxID=74873 RepID=A0A084VE70_ANOSI|nr:thioester-containing protein 1 [Anopheles sinensis]
MEGYTKDAVEILNLAQTAFVRKNSNTVVNFEVPPNLPVGQYKLSILGQGGFNFNEQISLVYLDKSLSGLIQLNKPVFKPGDSVNFRVVVLDAQLKPPADVKSVQVTIHDPNGNVIRKWSRGHLHVGVFEGALQLLPQPILGAYIINVTSDGNQLVSKAFQVKEYVLSLFDVEVFPAVIPLLEHEGLSLIVTAKYYTGQPVKGTAKVDLYLADEILEHSKTVNLYGQQQMEFRFNSPLEMTEEIFEARVIVTFTQKNTNQTITKDEKITIYKQQYQVELTTETPMFYQGLPFNYILRILLQDGSPAKDVTVQVIEGQASDNSDKVLEVEKTAKSNKDGIIKLTMHPKDTTDTITLSVLNGGQEIFYDQIGKQQFGNTFIKVEQISVSKSSVQLMVKCNKQLPFFMYYVISKGNIVDSGFVHSKTSSYKLQLDTVSKLMPKAKVFVATVVDKVVLHDIAEIDFDELQNNFDLKLNENRMIPSSQIKLRMTGSPGAYVALAAYDKSLLQHGEDHDLLFEDIMNTFDGFHELSENEFDVFHSIGLFARYTNDLIFPFDGTHNSGRFGSVKQKRSEEKFVSFRTNFLESWLWQNLTIGPQGNALLQETVPDSTTAWHLTGFSIDPVLGLGIIKRPIDFTTSQPFYIVDNLPYSIKRGEVVLLKFIVFNNYVSTVTANVTLYNVDNQTELIGRSVKDTSFSKTIDAFAKAGTPVSFLVKPRKLGEMLVRVQASIDQASDTIERVIRVEPESLMRQKMVSRFFSHDLYVNKTYAMEHTQERKADAGSKRIKFSLTPNLLTSVAENLENLLSVPSGCGEQNMVRFVPNIVVLDYLTAVGSKDTRLINKATQLLRQGYQNQLKYRQSDGSYGVWSHSGGSVFLTAFVGKSLQAASKYISEIDASQVKKAYDWLASKQHSSGRFDEVGQVIHKDMQGSLRNGIALTAYVLSAFLEHPETTRKHTKVIDKGIRYLTSSLQTTKDAYDLSIATYALTLHGHSTKTAFLEKLIGMSTIQKNGTEMFWNRKSGNIETTAYALLSFVQTERYIEGTQIMRWLVQQRYVTGSFPRTQDTFVGLRALTRLAEKISLLKNDYSVQLRYANINREFRISGRDLVRKVHEEYVDDITGIAASVSGIGFGLLELTYAYSVDRRNLTNHFTLELEKTLSNSGYKLDLRVCGSYIPRLSDTLSNMALVEVNFPSGYVAERNPISNASKMNPIRNIETRFGGTSVVVYYNNMGIEKNCFTVTATRRSKVALKRPAYVLVYDYYEIDLQAIKVYEVDSQSICDICEDDDCPETCA